MIDINAKFETKNTDRTMFEPTDRWTEHYPQQVCYKNPDFCIIQVLTNRPYK